MRAYQQADEIALVHSGEDFFIRLVRLLDEAQQTVHLQTYIYDEDDTGRLVAEALKRAAQRGVQVRVMVDSFGSKDLSLPFVEELRQAGVDFRFFLHLVSIRKWRAGRTLHHKVAVADGCCALVGGINIADKYRGTEREAAWLDFAVWVRGAVCRQLDQWCTDIFLHQYWKTPKWRKGRHPLLPEGSREGLVRFRRNDWMRRKTEIYQSYAQAISASRQSLIIVASYFLPGQSVRRRLKAAARRGVDVRILLTGPSDVALSRLAEDYLAYWLLKNNIRVFRWEKSVMHGKTILVDDQWASLGSYNINRLSRLRSLELNADIVDPAFTANFRQYLDDLLLHRCTEVRNSDAPDFSNRWQRWKARLAYHFAVYLMRFLFPGRR